MVRTNVLSYELIMISPASTNKVGNIHTDIFCYYTQCTNTKFSHLSITSVMHCILVHYDLHKLRDLLYLFTC